MKINPKNIIFSGCLVLFMLFLVSSGCLKRSIHLEPDLEGLGQAVQLVMTSLEREIYNKLQNKQDKKEFLDEFWAKRDPDLSTEVNEFKIEFEKRLDFVNTHFQSEGIPGWKTDRGRIYMYLGPPDQTYQQPFINSPSVKARITWVYYKYRTGVIFEDRLGNGTYEMRIDRYHSLRLLNAINRAKFGLLQRDQAHLDKASSEIRMNYDHKKKELFIQIPLTILYFEEDKDRFEVSLLFEIYIYDQNGQKVKQFSREKYFSLDKEFLKREEDIISSFPVELNPGKHYFDVKISDSSGIAKFRQIKKMEI